MEHQKTAVIITGAGGLIGQSIVSRALQSDHQVIAIDMDDARLEALAKKWDHPDLQTMKVDVSKEDNVAEAASQLTESGLTITGLVNNAAIARPDNTPLMQLSLEEWRGKLAVNLDSVFLCSKHFLPFLTVSGGSIINISSTRALMSEPNCEIYAAAKGGLEAFTHAAAISLGPKVRVNAIRAGWIADPSDQETRDIDHDQHPAGRVGVPEDIVAAVMYLLDGASSFMTGQVLTLDGGMTRKMIYKD